MASTAMRVALLLAVSCLLTLGYCQVNTQAGTPIRTTHPPALQRLAGTGDNAPSLPTGIIYTQPISSSGTLYQSSWLPPNGGGDLDQYVWDNFTLYSTQTVTEIDWFGGYDPAKLGTGGPVFDFSVAIFPSIPAGTQPDVVNPPLVQYQAGGNAGETLFGTVGSTTIYAYTFTLPTPFTATAGTKYWVQLEAFQHGPPDWGIVAGTGGDRQHFQRYAAAGNVYYRFFPGDTAFALLGPLNYPYQVHLPLVYR
jgi:hypothetical protein